MAAWTCRVDSIDSDGFGIIVFCTYYLATDTQFLNVLHGERFVFQPDATQQVMVSTVKNAGASARSVLAVKDALLPNVGATLNIP